MEKENLVYFCGDLHGDLSILYKWNKMEKGATLIQVGDFGYGNTYAGAVKIGRRVKEKGNQIYVIRGNHDNPAWFDGRKLGNLQFLPDYSILNKGDKKFLLIGGGISLDRTNRKPNTEYFFGEEVYVNREFFHTNSHFDVLVTHVAPRRVTGFPPPKESQNVLHWTKQDWGLLKALKEEEDKISEIERLALHPDQKDKRWYYGHFHKSISLREENCFYRGLDINEIVSFSW